EIEEQGASRTVGRVTNLPVDRLRNALERASAPLVEHVLPIPSSHEDAADLPNLVRIRGRNLMQEGLPRVTVGGEPVSVVRANERELVIAPQAHQMAGELVVEPAPRRAAAMAFDLRPFWRGGSGGNGGNGAGGTDVPGGAL